MQSFFRRVWNALVSGSQKRKTNPTQRLMVEALEDRCTPAGTVSGVVYLNEPDNGLIGASIHLSGTPTAAPIIPVNLTALTDANGAFSFTGLPAGSYHISTGPFTGLVGTVKIGSVTSSPDVVIDSPVVVGGVTSVVAQGGMDPNLITLQMFLNTSPENNFPFQSAVGAGTPNNTPFVKVAIPDQVLGKSVAISSAVQSGRIATITTSAAHGFDVGQSVTIAGVSQAGYNGTFIIRSVTSTTFKYLANSAGLGASSGGTASVGATRTIDLAGYFADPTITESSVTMNISDRGVAKQINLTLTDAATPQAVANFYDYVNAGAYDNNFFFRNTSTAGDGIDIIQAGRAIMTNGNRPTVGSTSFPTIPDEIAALNLKGTIATANNGSANSASDQFFFNTSNNPGLDHLPSATQDQQGYTVFGRVADTASQAVLDSLTAVATSNFSGSSTIAAVSGATESGNTVTITTTSAHRLMVGQSVTISSVNVAGYNGSFTITSVPSATTFTYTNTVAGLANSGNGTATGTGFLINQLPLDGSPLTDFPTDASKYLIINNVVINKRDDFLTYSIESNSNAAVATATLTNEHLKLTALTAGTTQITVKATDRFGNSTVETFTVTVPNDHDPVISSNGGGATASIGISENSSAVTTVTATDADAVSTLTYGISGGADAAKFSINPASGSLTFITAPDFEAPTDANSNNVYEVTVQVSDGTRSDTQAISVNIFGVNDNNPVITSNGGGATAAVTIPEGTTAVTTVTATDADLPGDTLAYSINGGDDAIAFTIGSSSGALAFISAPFVASPGDLNGDNVYEVIVQVSDGAHTTTQAISVTVM